MRRNCNIFKKRCQIKDIQKGRQRLFYTQWDYNLLQCSVSRHSKTYDNGLIRRMVAEQKDMKIPSELIPYCPACGKPITANLRCDDKFVQDGGWFFAYERYEKFIETYINKRAVYLEPRVENNTPAINKYPFWRLTQQNPKAAYVCINYKKAICPDQIAKQPICLNADIGEVIGEII